MRFPELVLPLMVSLSLAWPRPAEACGPEFPPAYLEDRAGTLLGLPDGSFALEARRLLPPPTEVFAVVEVEVEPKGARLGGGARETELYLEGAKAFHQDLDIARARFGAVLALPADQRRRFSAFAAFMLGRMAGSAEEARTHFAQVRALVRAGFDDPLGLAVASLGMEARWMLDEGDFPEAVALYAQQAGHGSGQAVTSLLLVARRLASDTELRAAGVSSPLVRRLLAAYVWTRDFDPEYGGGDEVLAAPPKGLLEELSALPTVEAPHMLCAAAYRAGRFELAGRLAASSDQPLARWVEAKLAARRGDREEAERLLAKASSSFSPSERWWGWEWSSPLSPLSRIASDRTVLSLAKASWGEALLRASEGGTWMDLAYVAERVVTLNALLAFVRERFPEPALGRLSCYELRQQQEEDPSQSPPSTECNSPWEPEKASALRHLLARRLLRADRYDEALTFFDDSKDREHAWRYREARLKAVTAWDRVDRAQALWEAAQIARRQGLELLGTEVAPDWAYADGNYEVSSYVETEAPPGARIPGPDLLTEAERRLAAANGPVFPDRFHYRRLAVSLAERASELVPKRSQAYATLLCGAARWGEPERLWKKYVANGAATTDIRSFGQDCAAPDFEGARNFHRRLPFPWPRPRNWGWALVMTAAVVLAGRWIRRGLS